MLPTHLKGSLPQKRRGFSRAAYRKLVLAEGQNGARCCAVLDTLILRASDLQGDVLAIDDPRTTDCAGDALGKRVADESPGRNCAIKLPSALK